MLDSGETHEHPSSCRSFIERTASWTTLALGFVALAAFLHSVEWGLQGDTFSLIQGARGALSCLREARLGDCPEAGQFSFLQLIWSGIWVALGLSDSAVLRVLAGVNLILSIHCVITGHRSLEKLNPLESLPGPFFQKTRQFIWLALWIGGCLPWYARTTFTEMLSAWTLLLLWLTPPQAKRLEWLLGFACTTLKETAWVLVIPLLIVKHWPFWREGTKGWRLDPKLLWSSLSAVGLGLIVNFGLNFFRFGTWKNIAYLHPTHFTPDLETRWQFFQGIWLSPLGGIAPFLPVFFGLWCTGWVVFFSWIFRSPRDHRRHSALWGDQAFWRDRDLIQLVFFLVLPLLQSLLLSGWFAPLGWKTWGPRLMIPLIPIVSLGLLITLPKLSGQGPKESLHSSQRSTTSSLRSVFAILLTLAFGFPHLKAVFDPPSLDRLLTLSLDGCIGVTVETAIDQYYRCTKEALGGKWSSQYFREYGGLPDTPERKGLLVVVLLFSGALLYRGLPPPHKTNSTSKLF